jgi:hypothetical protein
MLKIGDTVRLRYFENERDYNRKGGNSMGMPFINYKFYYNKYKNISTKIINIDYSIYPYYILMKEFDLNIWLEFQLEKVYKLSNKIKTLKKLIK